MTDEETDNLEGQELLDAVAAERLRKWRMKPHKSMGYNGNLVGNHMLDPIIDELENNGALTSEANRFVTRFLDNGWTLGRAIYDDPALQDITTRWENSTTSQVLTNTNSKPSSCWGPNHGDPYSPNPYGWHRMSPPLV